MPSESDSSKAIHEGGWETHLASFGLDTATRATYSIKTVYKQNNDYIIVSKEKISTQNLILDIYHTQESII